MPTPTTTSSTTGLPAPVIPLQRADRDLPRRPDTHAAPQPASTDTAFWDAEAQALFDDEDQPRRVHGRRCSCCRPALAAATEAAS